MNGKVLILLIFFPNIFYLNLQAQQAEIKDLTNEWLVYKNDRYEPFKNQSNVSTVYLQLDISRYSGKKLKLQSSRPFDIFINGVMAGTGNNFSLSVDSLSNIYRGSSLLLGLHQDGIRKKSIKTFIEELSPRIDYLTKRSSTSFRDFAIIGMLVLLIILVAIIRLNPKLASDYFSVTKIFSMREGDDTHIYTRITSSTNILFYVYCSLLLSYYLLIIFHFVQSSYPSALYFDSSTFYGTVGQWLQLSIIVLTVFFFKIILVFALSYLFGIKELAGLHFFNWVRLLLVIFGAFTVVLFMYFVSHGNSEQFHLFLLKSFGWILGAWMVLIFLKLSGKMSASMFHLFSYICATELIPFLLTIKVLYK